MYSKYNNDRVARSKRSYIVRLLFVPSKGFHPCTVNLGDLLLSFSSFAYVTAADLVMNVKVSPPYFIHTIVSELAKIFTSYFIVALYFDLPT